MSINPTLSPATPGGSLAVVTTSDGSDDPHGYMRLKRAMLGFAAELSGAGHVTESEQVEHAAAFYGGSPSEFLGESRAAMDAVLGSGLDLPAGLVQRMKSLVAEIDEGFRAIGGS